MAAPPIILTIAGFDPSSGAGVTADLKVIAAHESYGVAAITALTVQSTLGVRQVHPIDPAILAATLDELAADFAIDAVHIGMLANHAIVTAVADFLEKTRLPHIVLDPILRSSSGAELLDPAGTRALIERLLPLAEVVTPNLDEAAALAGLTRASGAAAGSPANSSTTSSTTFDGTKLETITFESMSSALDAMRAFARQLHTLGATNVVVTAGHLEKAIDLLSLTTSRGIEQEVFKATRQSSNSTHGTGCAFATAIACHLAHGRGLPEAVLLAKAYVSAAIANAQPIGHGAGPLHHLYRMQQQRRPSAVISDPEHLFSRK
ncbi:MAG: bifunctional hydroxymethylpyrimidine kinase/phosphomethylpyrimidine kinase [Terriglobales bacterium]|jgi:hydroxymethylpyrimidine/phosphomethylpyrimidine kinase